MSRANWATSGFDDMRAKPTRAVQRLRPRAYESPVWQYRVARTDDLRPKRRHDARSLQRPKHRRRTSPEHRSGPQDRRRDHPSLIRSIARPSAMTCYLATHRRRRSLDRGCDRSHRIASHRPSQFRARSPRAQTDSNRERRRLCGAMAPSDDTAPRIEAGNFPSARAISFSDWPLFHRFQRSALCELESARPTLCAIPLSQWKERVLHRPIGSTRNFHAACCIGHERSDSVMGVTRGRIRDR